MTRQWIREEPARWDQAKADAFGDLGPDVVGLGRPDLDSPIGDQWWRVEDNGRTVGYGRLDDSWGNAEILVVVAPGDRGLGVGAFVLDELETEADRRHLNYLYNVVRPHHPDAERVITWLTSHGFAETADGEYRKQVPRRSPD